MKYISLFSSAGIGTYNLKKLNFEHVLTNELISKRIDIQKLNASADSKTKYITGSIEDNIDNIIEISKKEKIDIIISTPPCQSMSTLNNKTKNNIVKNSLVVNSLKIIKNVEPNFFIIENVRNFLNSICEYEENKFSSISEAIDYYLPNYSILKKVINFKDYGSNSSRPRTLVIGVHRRIKNLSPVDIFPEKKEGLNLRKSIGHLKSLKNMGEKDNKNELHYFRPYEQRIRDWITDLKEGESAFDNKDLLKRPHKVVDGKLVYYEQKITNKYKRNYWNNISPCIHTRSDVLASQMTIHPNDDRVFSIEELRILMNIPSDFKFYDQKKTQIEKEDRFIREIIGEAVPTNIFYSIAKRIKEWENNLDFNSIREKQNERNINKKTYDAFYTNKEIVHEMVLAIKNKEKIRTILEPSVGNGAFIKELFFHFSNLEKLTLVDIDKNVLDFLKKNLSKDKLKKIHFINSDFISYDFKKEKFDLVIGNPPFTKINKNNIYNGLFTENYSNTIPYFIEKSLSLSSRVSIVLPKYFLNSSTYKSIRVKIKNNNIIEWHDYGIDKNIANIELISLYIDNNTLTNNTNVFSYFDNKRKLVNSNNNSYFFVNDLILLYRDKKFDEIYNNKDMERFKFYRNRTITNKDLLNEGKYWVIKSKNIKKGNIVSINNYDKWTNSTKSLNELDIKDAYLVPNFTYNFRIAKKPKQTLTNGSCIILIPLKNNIDINFMNTDSYKNYFNTIMNFSKYTININNDISKLL